MTASGCPPPAGKYRVRLAQGADDVERSQCLRHRAFFGSPGRDMDRYDALCRHVLIEKATTGALVGSYRMQRLPNGKALPSSYAAQFYDLGALHHYPGPLLELGRFCVDPDAADPDILRLAWANLTREVDKTGITLLFGCSSFPGTDPLPHARAFARLRARHLAPNHWAPKSKAQIIHRFAQTDEEPPQLQTLPPLLRTYLSMGGWVSDHAVVDSQMNTLHVFTGVEIVNIPPARKKALRAIAGQLLDQTETLQQRLGPTRGARSV